jgi:hypothetical protein
MLPTIATAVATVIAGRVKPSDFFIVNAHTVSSRPAINNSTHATAVASGDDV